MAPTAESDNELEAKAGTDEQPVDLEKVEVTEHWINTGPPPRGAGWWGAGTSMQVHHGHKSRALEDGGGLCSPGKWRFKDRRPPDMQDLGKKVAVASGVDLGSWQQHLYRIMAGHQ